MYYVKSRSYLEGTMRLNKMTGRVIATMGIAAMMMTQTAGVMAAEQTENKQLKVVYYNQADEHLGSNVRFIKLKLDAQ